jgi:FkbM family methyltransferase
MLVKATPPRLAKLGLRSFVFICWKLARIVGSNSYRRSLLTHRVLAGVEHESVLRKLHCTTVLDIGANRGQFALVARRSFPEACIVSVEPLPAPAARFRAVFAADQRVTLHQAAIGPERGEATMHVSRRDDSSSLLPITDRQNALFPGTAEVGTARVKVALLRDFFSEDQIEPPALLKLDVQGFELQALRGCESLLNRFAYVYVECSYIELYAGQALANEVITWLRERGFRLSGTYNPTTDREGRIVQADFLFSRESVSA